VHAAAAADTTTTTCAHASRCAFARRTHTLTRSPWIKVLERPGDDHGNRSEDNPAQNPHKQSSGDVGESAPEKVAAGG
jgi:hypothetical protein